VIQFKESLRVLPIGGLLLGLSLYSYHARELLVCWLYFGVLFVCMMLVILIGELGVYAGECVAVWARSTAKMTPVLEFVAVEPPLKNTPEPSFTSRPEFFRPELHDQFLDEGAAPLAIRL
jgi:hypothetical protein